MIVMSFRTRGLSCHAGLRIYYVVTLACVSDNRTCSDWLLSKVNPARVLQELHGNRTEGFLLKNLYCLECTAILRAHALNVTSSVNCSDVASVEIILYLIIGYLYLGVLSSQENQKSTFWGETSTKKQNKIKHRKTLKKINKAE